ncbi:MAG: T9SS type A sorting domain-containing protein [Saprospiraceae bacterium]|nr:T9SS type A sorting domain-containing protein [Saprospiraceae bacterium]
MTTDPLDLTSYTEITVDFTYVTISMDNEEEDFWLQISLDGGVTFTTVEEWNLGDEFQNGLRYFDAVTIPGEFTENTVLRFRCDASGNNDQVYIDNVGISGCLDLTGLIAGPERAKEIAKEEVSMSGELELDPELEAAPTELQLFPNPVADELTVRFSIPELTDVTLVVTDLQGRRIGMERLLNAKGTMEQRIAVERYPAGIYLLHLITPEGKQTRKFVVARN